MNLSFEIKALEYFTPELQGWQLWTFLSAASVITIAAIIVQITVFRTIKRLGSRIINQMIIPTLVVSIVVTSLDMISLTIKTLYYPMADLTGSWFCHAKQYITLGANIHFNCHTFFLTLFRYICIFHDEKILKWDLTPKLIGRLIIGLQMALSIACTCFIFESVPTPRNVDACLGHYELHYDKDAGQSICPLGGILVTSLCKISVLIHIITSSNIPEAFMLYACFKAIRDQNEKVKDMIGEKHYSLRKRDNGILISISIVQWSLEFIFFIFNYIYFVFLWGQSNFADKFFSLYSFTFTVIIQPSFYLSGDAAFRRNLENQGLIKAVWLAMKSH